MTYNEAAIEPFALTILLVCAAGAPIITSAISGIGKTYKHAQNAVSMATLGTPAGLRICGCATA